VQVPGQGRRLAALAVCPLLLAACHSCERSTAAPSFSGPANTIRIALAGLRWPLDPASVEGRDEIVLARALLATPLRTARDGTLRPGLCTSWRSSAGARLWQFRCRRARAIAIELRRVRALRYSPASWLFADAVRITAPERRTVLIRLRRPWRRFAHALTVPAAAPLGVAGPFRVVSASPHQLVAVRGTKRLLFRRLGAREAARAFLNGRVDEAPVPLGDLRAFRLNPDVREAVRVRPLLGVDIVGFRLAGGALGGHPELRRVYWETAARGDYAALVPEYAALPAFALLPGGGVAPTLRDVRRARGKVARLPAIHVGVATATHPEESYGAGVVTAAWRDLGLTAVSEPTATFRRRLVNGSADAWFRRLVAPYPRPEALLAALLLPVDGRNPWLGRPSPAEGALRRALAVPDPRALLAQADSELQSSAAVIPLAGAVDARLVSPRLTGWREDVLGAVDYTLVGVR
jgi:hypothetical protein